MSDENLFDDYYRLFRAELVQEAHGEALGGEATADFKENVLTSLVLARLDEAGATDSPEVCHSEVKRAKGIAKVNGYAINDDGDELHLFTTVLVDSESPTALPAQEVRDAADRAVRYFKFAKASLFRELETASEAHGMAQRIHEVADTLRRIKIFVLSDGKAPQLSFRSSSVDGVRIDVEVWDAQRLFRSQQSGFHRTEITVDLEKLCGAALPCLPIPSAAPDYMAYLCIFPGEVLYRIYSEYGPAVLEYNVRSFLQAKGKVNKGIRETLKKEPHHFFAFNNGLATTADEVVLTNGAKGAPAIRCIRGFQIVNGGQTTASIHLAAKEDRVDVSQVLVPVKITIVQQQALEGMVERISLSANSQNAVTMADFSANHPFHVEVERLSREVWTPGERGQWFYERARGQYQVARIREGKRFEARTPPARKFTKTDLAKYINCWNQLPHVVGRGSQKNFVAFQAATDRLGKNYRPDALWFKHAVAKAIVFRQMDRIARQLGFSAYRANIIAYSVAYLSHRAGKGFDLMDIWNRQAVSTDLDRLLREWAPQIDEAIRNAAAGRNVTEWAKKEDCWVTVRALEFDLPKQLPPEFKEAADEEGVDPDKVAVLPADRANVERCMKIDADTWFRIQAWGRQTGHLKAWQAGVALSLAGLASDAWVKEPTRKQALRGTEILDVAEEHGLFE